MALTRDFRETVRERASRDEAYRKELLLEAVNEILNGNVDVGKAMLRDYANATITFPERGKKLNKSSKSIHRMLGPGGNPRMDSIVGILKVLQDEEHITLRAELRMIG
jgi:DNA-binding phage protein